MAQQVSVRLAVVGGTQFRNDLTAAGRDGSQAMDRIANSSSRMRQPVQSASQILGEYAGQALRGGSAGQSFADVIPRLVSGFGMLNPLAAIAGGVMGALAAEFLRTKENSSDIVKELQGMVGTMGKVDSATVALKRVQQEYNSAITTSGSVSTSAANLVIANSEREFLARKKVLEAEMTLSKLRGYDNKAMLKNLQDTFALEANAIVSRRPVPVEPLYGAKQTKGRSRLRGDPQQAKEFDKFLKDNEKKIAEIRSLEGQLEIEQIDLERAAELLKTTFSDIASGDFGPGIKPGKGGAGAATKEQNAALKEQQKLFDETRTKAERYAIEVEKIEALYKSGAISTEVYQRKMAMLKETYEAQGAFASSVATTLKSSMDSLFTGIFEGGNKAAESVENLGKKLASMATQQATYQLLAKLMPATFGAGGFIPLLENANGNAFSGGQVTAFATGGVFDSPMMFPMKGGAGMLGEAGPEAIMPLTRIGGKLGVRAAGGGGGGGGQVVQIIDQRGKNAPEVERTSRRGPDGAEYVTMIIKDATARGDLDGANRARFGSAPQKVKR